MEWSQARAFCISLASLVTGKNRPQRPLCLYVFVYRLCIRLGSGLDDQAPGTGSSFKVPIDSLESHQDMSRYMPAARVTPYPRAPILPQPDTTPV